MGPLAEGSLLESAKTWKRDTACKTKNTSLKQTKGRMEVEPSLTLSNDLKRDCELLERLQRSKYCGEVPATKLAALHKVLQSEFLNAVREVYEHIYETVERWLPRHQGVGHC